MPGPNEKAFEMFENRLVRMFRHTGKWARRQKISCYRVYDRDIPYFPLCVEIYENRVLISEYAKNHGKSEEEHQTWLRAVTDRVRKVIGVPRENVFFKERKRQKGIDQYEKLDSSGSEFVVTESGLKFLVNLSDYLDSGLFLDHRITRGMVRDESAGRRVLNLFAYTGSFSVYAASGRALSTVTLDLSNSYLDRARRNMELNGFTGEKHEFVRADAFDFLGGRSPAKYDLIVLDPPTFSTSKKMTDTLDVQRDHVRLLEGALYKLTSGGILYFSTNLRTFKMDTASIHCAELRDITKQTIPKDFRDEKIHHCFRLVR